MNASRRAGRAVCAAAIASLLGACAAAGTAAPNAPSAGAPSSGGPARPATPAGPGAPARCAAASMSSRRASQSGAAGTIRSVWRITNTSSASCVMQGYPGMDMRASAGWLGVRVARGGYPDIDASPARVVVGANRSAYFVSYWSDVETAGASCRTFDRVKITLPNETRSLQLASAGCVSPSSVRVGPVTGARPAA